MARDYAKRKQGGTGRRPAARRNTTRRNKPAGGGWRWYGAGVLTGVFLSFLFYLGTLPPPAGVTRQTQGPAETASTAPEPRFDFYTLLPEQTIDVEVEPEPVTRPRAGQEPAVRYLLQAGSFRQRDDADRRRAELLLLGLDPKVEETSGENGRWYRVYLGPFDSHASMSRARSLTAGQDIDTLLLKRSDP